MKTITAGMIPQEKYNEFKALYFEKYAVMLTDEETTRMAIDFLNLMRILIYPEQKSTIR